MADPRAFISFDFDNNATEKLLFAGQIKNSRTPFNAQDWSSKVALPQRQWEALIEEKISKCNLLIVLVGPRTFWAEGVEKEISMASRNNVPFFGIYVGGANALTLLPAGLQRNNMVSWEWEAIADMIDKSMRVGKNAPAQRVWR